MTPNDQLTPERLAALKAELDAYDAYFHVWQTATSESERRQAAVEANTIRERLALSQNRDTIRALLEERLGMQLTLETLSNQETVKALTRSMEDVKEGRFVSWETLMAPDELQLYVEGQRREAKAAGAREAYKAVREWKRNIKHCNCSVCLNEFLDAREREAQS